MTLENVIDYVVRKKGFMFKKVKDRYGENCVLTDNKTRIKEINNFNILF